MQTIELNDNPSKEQMLEIFNKIPSINTVITRRRLAGVSRSKRRRLHEVKRKSSLRIVDESWQLIPRGQDQLRSLLAGFVILKKAESNGQHE